jgi:hypothetical protein
MKLVIAAVSKPVGVYEAMADWTASLSSPSGLGPDPAEQGIQRGFDTEAA